MGRRDHALSDTERNLKKIIWKIAIYIRLSKEDGNDISYSVLNQKALISKHIENLDKTEEYIIVDCYIDDGLTGTDDTRGDFQRMLRDIEIKRVNCVIVKDLSRPFRNYADQGYYLEYFFPLHDVRFICLQLPFLDSYKHPETMQSIAVPMQGVVNDNHCRETSLKVRYVFNNKREEGQFIGAFPPYGYAKDPKDKSSFIIDEEAAAVVRDIYSWFVAEGMSKMSIAKRLTARGTLNPASYKRAKGMKYKNPHDRYDNTLWCPATVTKILKNPMYLGHMVQGRQRVKSYKVHNRITVPESEWFIKENTHEPIIDQEIFDKAQGLHQRDTRTSPLQKELYLFSGFLRCNDCKRAMHRKKERKHAYYLCRTNIQQSVCTRHSIREDHLTEAVLQTIQAQIQLIYSLAELNEKINTVPGVKTQAQRLNENFKSRERELEKITRLKDSLYENWQSGDITRDDYRRLKAKYEAQYEQLHKAIKALSDEQAMRAEGVNNDNPYLQYFQKYNGIKELNRGILIELVDNIFIHEDKSITIQFKYADQYKRMVEFMESNMASRA